MGWLFAIGQSAVLSYIHVGEFNIQEEFYA
jgi:hypothetical protein